MVTPFRAAANWRGRQAVAPKLLQRGTHGVPAPASRPCDNERQGAAHPPSAPGSTCEPGAPSSAGSTWTISHRSDRQMRRGGCPLRVSHAQPVEISGTMGHHGSRFSPVARLTHYRPKWIMGSRIRGAWETTLVSRVGSYSAKETYMSDWNGECGGTFGGRDALLPRKHRVNAAVDSLPPPRGRARVGGRSGTSRTPGI